MHTCNATKLCGGACCHMLKLDSGTKFGPHGNVLTGQQIWRILAVRRIGPTVSCNSDDCTPHLKSGEKGSRSTLAEIRRHGTAPKALCTNHLVLFPRLQVHWPQGKAMSYAFHRVAADRFYAQHLTVVQRHAKHVAILAHDTTFPFI